MTLKTKMDGLEYILIDLSRYIINDIVEFNDTSTMCRTFKYNDVISKTIKYIILDIPKDRIEKIKQYFDNSRGLSDAEKKFVINVIFLTLDENLQKSLDELSYFIKKHRSNKRDLPKQIRLFFGDDESDFMMKSDKLKKYMVTHFSELHVTKKSQIGSMTEDTFQDFISLEEVECIKDSVRTYPFNQSEDFRLEWVKVNQGTYNAYVHIIVFDKGKEYFFRNQIRLAYIRLSHLCNLDALALMLILIKHSNTLTLSINDDDILKIEESIRNNRITKQTTFEYLYKELENTSSKTLRLIGNHASNIVYKEITKSYLFSDVLNIERRIKSNTIGHDDNLFMSLSDALKYVCVDDLDCLILNKKSTFLNKKFKYYNNYFYSDVDANIYIFEDDIFEECKSSIDNKKELLEIQKKFQALKNKISLNNIDIVFDNMRLH